VCRQQQQQQQLFSSFPSSPFAEELLHVRNRSPTTRPSLSLGKYLFFFPIIWETTVMDVHIAICVCVCLLGHTSHTEK
jgi:hypothetical protein